MDNGQASSGEKVTPTLDWVPSVCVYHAPCSDGYGAAWVLQRKFGRMGLNYIEASVSTLGHNSKEWIKRLSRHDVVMFDFTFPRPLMKKLAKVTRRLQVYDHHFSAAQKLKDLPYCYFDMSKSGAMLAWEAVFPEDKAPKLIRYTQDQDLGRFDWGHSEAIGAVINSTPQQYVAWKTLAEELESRDGFRKIVRQGEEILTSNYQLLDRLVRGEVKFWNIHGHEVAAVCCPDSLRPLICDHLSKNSRSRFVGAYTIKEKGLVTWSLRLNRTHRGRLDVSSIANLFPGGGGHKRSAGFSVPVRQMNFTDLSVWPKPRQFLWNVWTHRKRKERKEKR